MTVSRTPHQSACTRIDARGRGRLVVWAAGKPEPVRKQLPIFPLNVVALPYATVPLLVFEPRWVPRSQGGSGAVRVRAPHLHAAPCKAGGARMRACAAMHSHSTAYLVQRDAADCLTRMCPKGQQCMFGCLLKAGALPPRGAPRACCHHSRQSALQARSWIG